MRGKLFRIWRLFLPFFFIFFLIHFLKDITQDILKIPSVLDIFGNAEEDLSGSSSLVQGIFYIIGIASVFAEVFILISILVILKRKTFSKLELVLFVVILVTLFYFILCTLLDPRIKFLFKS